MEDYFAAIKNAKLGTMEEIKLAYEAEGIQCIIEKYDDEFQMQIGQAEDVLRVSLKNGMVIFVTWQYGTGDEMVLELTDEILNRFGLSNSHSADYI